MSPEAFDSPLPYPAIPSPPAEGALGPPLNLGEYQAGGTPDDGPGLLCRSDGQWLLYPDALNSLHAEPGAGKTFLALYTALAVAAGPGPGQVMYLDWESTPQAMAARLTALDAHPRAVSGLLYLSVVGALQDSDTAWLAHMVSELPVRLVVVDSLGEPLAYAGDGNDDATVARWLAARIRPLAGPALACWWSTMW
jgi:hypothetical protein